VNGSLRVLLTADSVGGVWQYALDLARALAPLGLEAVVAHMGPPPSAAQHAEAAGVRVIETGLALDWLVDGPEPVAAAAQALSALARRERVDVVHLNTPALAAALGVAVPVVVADHGTVATWWEAARPGEPLDPQFAWHRRMTGEGLRAADAVIAPSAGYAEAVARIYGYDRPVRVVHNGRAAASPSTAEPVAAAVTAGRLWDAAKRTALLDAVAARLSVPFRAAGARVGPHGEAVATEHLIALGSLGHDAMAAELARRPVFVSAAIFEPFGLAVLEAAQSGCALVLADTPVFRELWDGAATFVAGDNSAAYAAVIEALVADPTARAHDGEAARARAARYTPAAMAEGVHAVYDAVLAERAPRERAA
jgi:glycosyltransferase involved in cell wall biosynthesis